MHNSVIPGNLAVSDACDERERVHAVAILRTGFTLDTLIANANDLASSLPVSSSSKVSKRKRAGDSSYTPSRQAHETAPLKRQKTDEDKAVKARAEIADVSPETMPVVDDPPVDEEDTLDGNQSFNKDTGAAADETPGATGVLGEDLGEEESDEGDDGQREIGAVEENMIDNDETDDNEEVNEADSAQRTNENADETVDDNSEPDEANDAQRETEDADEHSDDDSEVDEAEDAQRGIEDVDEGSDDNIGDDDVITISKESDAIPADDGEEHVEDSEEEEEIEDIGEVEDVEDGEEAEEVEDIGQGEEVEDSGEEQDVDDSGKVEEVEVVVEAEKAEDIGEAEEAEDTEEIEEVQDSEEAEEDEDIEEVDEAEDNHSVQDLSMLTQSRPMLRSFRIEDLGRPRSYNSLSELAALSSHTDSSNVGLNGFNFSQETLPSLASSHAGTIDNDAQESAKSGESEDNLSSDASSSDSSSEDDDDSDVSKSSAPPVRLAGKKVRRRRSAFWKLAADVQPLPANRRLSTPVSLQQLPTPRKNTRRHVPPVASSQPVPAKPIASVAMSQIPRSRSQTSEQLVRELDGVESDE
ncbi:hypothetical protein DFS34DRAFT_140217 [Phlyctochytrium arcticum]|nr:hypothetical protein DFS34DRAFT_140217 [Phlyctochytrium arcticum]